MNKFKQGPIWWFFKYKVGGTIRLLLNKLRRFFRAIFNTSSKQPKWYEYPVSAEFEEGSLCPHENCFGTLEWEYPYNCSCHLGHAPCSACMEVRLYCPVCGWKQEE